MNFKKNFPSKKPGHSNPNDRKDLILKNATPPDINYLESNGRGKSHDKQEQDKNVPPRH